jgi:hypothetical protein
MLKNLTLEKNSKVEKICLISVVFLLPLVTLGGRMEVGRDNVEKKVELFG